MSEAVRSAFNNISTDYDAKRRKFIPCFDDFYNIGTSILHMEKDNPEVLDLGAGTGLFSSYVSKRYPAATFTLIDISEGMLHVARTRFKDYPRVKFLIDDYSKYNFKEKYDIIISALSIHHLPDKNKERLYIKCYMLLEEHGIFVNADQVCGNTPFLDNIYKREWKKYIESTDLSKDEIQAGYERMKFDNEASLDLQLKWLREAGFKDVDCVYKYYNFAVMAGRKY